MSLIEQLGGYDSLKKEYEETLPLIQKGYKSKSMEIIRLLLLEHRRKHNIFEVWDKVVKASRLNDDKVYLVFEVADSLNWVKTSCGAFIDAPMFKHATDAEIKAWRRL